MIQPEPIVMKFGGTSVADARAFQRVIEIVRAESAGPAVIVVSAMSGVTDALLAAVKQAAAGDPVTALHSLEHPLARHHEAAATLLSESELQEFSARLADAKEVLEKLLRVAASPARAQTLSGLQDAIVSHGERLSATLLSGALRSAGIAARYTDARYCIITDEDHGRAAPIMDRTFDCTRAEIGPLLDAGIVPVLGGFIGASLTGATTTLGRGGSDYSAAIVGAALSAREIQIWTDVTGVLTTDPRLVPHAQTIGRLSYTEAAELAYFGAKVLHPKTIQPAVTQSIPLRICNSREPHEYGTLVSADSVPSPSRIKAIALKTNVVTIQVTSTWMLGAYGFMQAVFEIFGRNQTVVDVVTTSEVSICVSLDDRTSLDQIVRELREMGEVTVNEGRAIICVVGEGLRETPGIAAQVFAAISDINVALISQGASRINLTFAVEATQAREVVTRLHDTFFGAPATLQSNELGARESLNVRAN